MTTNIGEFARALGISRRAVRHYETLGLLAPAAVDPRNGYRTYGDEQLERGRQIARLKEAGLDLATIGSILDDPTITADALARHRTTLTERVAATRVQLARTDALLAELRPTAPLSAQIAVEAAHHALIVESTATSDTLDRHIRRGIQQLARAARTRHNTRCHSFSARFPASRAESFTVAIAGHLNTPIPGSTLQPAEHRLRVTWHGPLSQLHLAHRLLLDTARERRIATDGTIVEHYHDLAATRTDVDLTIADR